MDSTPKIVSCMKTAASKAGLPVPATQAVNDIIGISLRPAIARLFNLDCEKTTEAVVDIYRDEYLYHDKTPSPLFAGSLQLLQQLKQKGYQLAVATGKARPGLDRAMQETNTLDYFVTTRCADEAKSKPHPLMLEQITRSLGVQSEECVMIGDTEHDLAMAAAINMPGIGVSYGAQPPHKLTPHKPKAIVDNVLGLLNHL